MASMPWKIGEIRLPSVGELEEEGNCRLLVPGPETTPESEDQHTQTGGADYGLRTALRPQLTQNSIDVEFDRVVADA